MKAQMLALISFVILATVTYAQYGYGYSHVVLQQSSVTLINGGISKINYTVQLTSGNTWGTTINIVNAQALTSEGITTTLSKTYGNPPYNGNLTINISPSAEKGTYQMILNATGDDPSTNNTVLVINIVAPGQSTTTIQPNSSSNVTTSIAATTIPAASTTIPYNVLSNPVGSMDALYTGIAGIIVALIIAGALMLPFKGTPTRLDIWGAALIVIGTIAWLAGDYTFISTLLWAGVALLALGIIVWLAGDVMAGSFKKTSSHTALIVLGLVLIIVGMGVWLYGDFHGGGWPEVWVGVGLIVIGTLIWLAGNAIGGAFRMSRK